MRKAKEWKRRLLVGAFSLVLALGIFGIGFWASVISSCAAAQAKVTAPNGAKIRQDASTSSTMVGGAEKGKVLNVLSEVQGSDGYTWYQVQVNDTTTGYIRSDLVEVTGDIGGGAEGGTEGGSEGAAPMVEVSQVNPVNGTVFDDLTDIMDTASSAGQSLGIVPRETVVTVTGYVDNGEGRWYQANYSSEGTEVNGFILSEHVVLAADLTPLGTEPAPDSEPAPDETPKYELVEKDGAWLLVDNEENPGYGYPVAGLFDALKKNETLYEESEATVKSQKIIIIVLVFLLVGAVAGIAFLVFKIRDMSDSAYFNEVENETLRRRNASGGQGQSKQKAPMHKVGPEKQTARAARPETEGSQRTGMSQRSAGSAQGQYQRTTGSAQRSAASRSPEAAQSQRSVASQGQRTGSGTQGQRSAGAPVEREAGGAPLRRSTGQQRPAGSVQGQRASAPQGQRPSGASQGQRPMGSQGARKTEATSGQAPQGARQIQSTQGGGQKAQPKNFMADDEDFDFEYLNYDGDEEQ